MRPGILGWLAVIIVGAGGYWAPRPWRILLLVALVLVVMMIDRWQHRRQVVTTLRRLRHRQANHLQVMQGWLQLGRVNRAEDYIHSVNEHLAEEGRWYRELPLSWLYAVLMLDVLAESRGVRCQWHISRVRPARIRLFRFERSVRTAILNAGSAMDVHLDDQGFVISLLDPKAVPRTQMGVKVWQQGDTIVLMWHARSGTERSDGMGGDYVHR